MASVSTIILRSLRFTGEKTRGATLDATEAVECLAELNTFMESCQTERLMCYSIQQDSFALTANVSTYTIGTNGTINVARPTKLVDPVFVRDSSGYDSALTIIDLEQYGAIPLKSVGQTYPTHIYYDYGYSATSTASITIFPAPVAALTLFFSSWKQLQSFASITTQVLLPPGYQLFIESNFAIHLAAGVIPVSPELAKIARESRAAVKSLNIPDTVQTLDYGILPQYRGSSILTGP